MSSASASEVRVTSPKLGAPVSCRFLATYRGVLSHWYSGRPRACKGRDACPRAWHAVPPQWKGFAPAEVWDAVIQKWFPTVVEVTSSLEHALRGRVLRGEAWCLIREPGKDERGEVKGVFLERFDKVRSAFDVMPTLHRLFGYGEFLIDLPNPTPPPTMLEPSEDRGPKIPEELQPQPEPDGAEAAEILRKHLAKRGSSIPSSNGKGH